MNIDETFEGITTELFKANVIIDTAMKIMTEEQIHELTKRCFLDNITYSVDGDPLHGKRRLALIAEAKNHGLQICKSCGCTQTFGCEDGCSWHDIDLCSICFSMEQVEKKYSERLKKVRETK